MTSKYHKTKELIRDESEDGEINESESDDEYNNVQQINQVDYNYCLSLDVVALYKKQFSPTNT